MSEQISRMRGSIQATTLVNIGKVVVVDQARMRMVVHDNVGKVYRWPDGWITVYPKNVSDDHWVMYPPSAVVRIESAVVNLDDFK